MTDVPPVLGWDTETFAGRVKVLANSDGGTVETSDTDALLGFHCEQGRGRLNVWWNLGFDVAAILKPWIAAHAEALRDEHYRLIRLRREFALKAAEMQIQEVTAEDRAQLRAIIDEIAETETVDRMETDGFEIRVVGSKAFGVRPKRGPRKLRRYVWSFDAGNQYGTGYGHLSLQKAAELYLGESKTDGEEHIDRGSIGTIPGYYETNRDAIVRYCVRDAQLTASLMEATIRGYERLGLPFPERPFSTGSVSKEYLRQQMSEDELIRAQRLQRVTSMPAKAFRGGVFLLARLGHVDRPYILDINSAYPAAMATYPSLRDAVVVDGDDPRFASCYFKFYRIRARPCRYLPVKEKTSLRKVYMADGDEMEWTLAGPDVDVLRMAGHPFEFLSAVGIWTPPDAAKAFPFFPELYARKAAIKRQYGADSIEYHNIKVVLNGVYGVTAQSRPRTGKFTNYIFASYTTAECRAALWRKTLQVEAFGDRVVMWATDGLVIEGNRCREHERERASSDLGAWSFEEADEGVFFESGVYALRRGNRWWMKIRGLPGVTVETLSRCPTPSLEVAFESPVHLKEGLIQRRPEDIGIFETRFRTLEPVRAAAMGGQTMPMDAVYAPLSSYFTRSWPLWLLNEVHDGVAGEVFDTPEWRREERRKTKESNRGRSRRNPLHRMTLDAMIRLGV